MDSKWIWVLGLGLICLLYSTEVVEAKTGTLGQGGAVNQCSGFPHSGSQRTPQASQGCHGETTEEYKFPKPELDPFCRSKRRKAHHSRRAHCKKRKQQRRKQKKTNGVQPDEEGKIIQIITQKVGSAPILKHFIDRMGVVDIIDAQVPAHPNRKITHGEMVAALMVYLLAGGRALYRMEKWAGETAVLNQIFPQYQPGDWTDDRIDDTVDALYGGGLEPMQGSISVHIIEEFNLQLIEIHYDTTSVSMWGTYDQGAGQPAVLVTFGYSKDHRKDLKQIVEGMAVTGDGGVPIISGTHDGNTNDSVLPISYWERLRQVAGKSNFCFIGDCKIASRKTLTTICAQDGEFLTPLPMTEPQQKALIKDLKEGKLEFDPVDLQDQPKDKPIYENRTHRPSNRRKKDKPESKKDLYEVCEQPWEIEDDQGNSHSIRKLIVRNQLLAHCHAKTRERRLHKAEARLQALRGKLNKRKLKTREAVEAAKTKVLQECKVQGLIETKVEERVEMERKKIGKGRPGPNSQYVTEKKVIYDLSIERCEEAIANKALLDGIFLMVTNRDSDQDTPSSLLALYKRQYKVERIFSVAKGPLAVSPMLLEKPERICAMMFIMTLTLQLYTLIQRQAAQELLRRNRPLDGLMPNKIQTWRPQTKELLAAFDNICLTEIVYEGRPSSVHMTTLNSLQLEILALLGVSKKAFSPHPLSQKSGET